MFNHRWLVASGATALFAFAFAASGHASQTPAASFDCRKAQAPVELIICSDIRLAALDRQMAQNFWKHYRALPPERRESVLARQRDWLRSRLGACAIPDAAWQPRPLDPPDPVECLTRYYQWRQEGDPNFFGHWRDDPTAWHVRRFTWGKYPFEPLLLSSRDSKLCTALLSAFRIDYRRVHARDLWHDAWDRTRPPDLPLRGGRILRWASDSEAVPTSSVAMPLQASDVLEVDLDGDGHTQLLVHTTFQFNYHGNFHSLVVFDGADRDVLRSHLAARAPAPSYAYPGDIHPVQPAFGEHWLSMRSPILVFAYGGFHYLFFPQTQNEAQDGGQSVLRIRANGASEETCRFQTDVRIGASLRPGGGKPSTAIEAPEGFVAFQRAIARLQGVEGPYSGTMHTLSRIINRTERAAHLALLQPWELMWTTSVEDPHDPTPAMTRYRLKHWSYGTLPDRRVHRELEAALPRVLTGLAGYYQRHFGLRPGEARNAARLAIDSIIGAAFMFGVPDAPTAVPHIPLTDRSVRNAVHAFAVRYRHSPSGAARKRPAAIVDWPREATTLLRQAVIAGVPDADLEVLLGAGAETGVARSDAYWTYGFQPALMDSLEHPRGLEFLLAHGARVDEANYFGKTALMYAAQYNLRAAVEILLRHGANVNARTVSDRTRWSGPLQYNERTALMYAAENASTRLIERLIKAGADVHAKDSGGRTVFDYFSGNTKVRGAARTRIAKLLGGGLTPNE